MYVNEQKLQRFVTFVGTVFAIGFLISAMWILWRLKNNMVAKLATVTGFVVAFAAWLGFLTTAQRKDVIAATAAYAAVLVVFVSQPT
jgi:thiol:disulfide interchange protein